MRILALDTATEACSVALGLDGRVLERYVQMERGHGERLLPMIDEVLAEAGISLQSLQAIAFGRGPGGFTGVRLAASVAQGLAFGAGRPVLPLDSLLVVAEDARAASGAADTEVWVAMDARMGEVYAGRYACRGGEWAVLDAPALYELEALHVRWRVLPPRVIAGSALAAFGDRLAVGDAVCFPVERSRAEALLRVAQAAWRRGEAVDPDQALPLYLRDKVALTTAEREAARAAKEAAL